MQGTWARWARAGAALAVALTLSACASGPPAAVGVNEAENLSGASLEARIGGRELTLYAASGAPGRLIMRLNSGYLGTAFVEGGTVPGFEQVFRWNVQGNQLCTEYLAFGGVPTGDIDCVTVWILGDRITISRLPSTGGTEVFVGRIG